ncbi:acrosomal protein SP-10 isoform X2 [Tupaia chinensis]|uniref:Acrosomal protein SP-10 n=1 Tax=Tupaia chinensis TaxID=246437 RepID=L9LEL3_TUPCH|nr:acrosomal protein SP-10 isoform X2 [Tupaia chinensis]ELW72227.1 Acrosomal protein SP-10 [Tupaia chinensis]
MLLLLSLCLLGSAGGALGPPEEFSDSLDQASAQRLSGEYLARAPPSEAEALYETAPGESTLSEHASSEHGSGEHGSGEHAVGEHASDEHAVGEPASDQPSGEKPSGEHALAEHTSGENGASEPAAAEQAAGEPAAAEQAAGEPAAEQVSREQAVTEKPSGEQASGEQPSGAPPSTLGPAVNCHVCAYMSEQGKCLRGEGVCTTENSQQCMLKKIFEGGKLQFMVQGCENMCPSMNLFSHGTRMQIACCRNQSFCNRV